MIVIKIQRVNVHQIHGLIDTVKVGAVKQRRRRCDGTVVIMVVCVIGVLQEDAMVDVAIGTEIQIGTRRSLFVLLLLLLLEKLPSDIGMGRS